MNEEQRITLCKTSLDRIHLMLQTAPHTWRDFIPTARAIITHLDSTPFMRRPNRTREQIRLIDGLQRYAFVDFETGVINDIASWCSRQWLTILQREPQNLPALRGIGQGWLSRAQPALARIHSNEGRSSSSGESTGSRLSTRGASNEQASRRSATEAERRAGTADYVEARGYLHPATEYLERAVTSATAQRIVSGDLLCTAAEAYMSLGSASSPRVSQQHFGRALELLRAATEIPGYTLSSHLRQFLDDYGRLLG